MITGLRDIHTPTDVSIWPLASGIQLVITVILLLLSIGLYFFIKRWLFLRAKRIALKQLDQIEKRGITKDCLPQMSILLRRLVLAYYPRRQVASLTNERWLNFLNQHSKSNLDQAIIYLPYQKEIKNKAHAKKLLQQTRLWISNLKVN